MDNDNLTIKELLERYDLRTRQSIYDWCKKGAKIELCKDNGGRSYATPEQVALLDQLAEHLKKPDATLSNFVAVSTVQIDTPTDTVVDNSIDSNSSDIKQHVQKPIDTSIDSQLIGELASKIGIAIASHLGKELATKDPLWHYAALERARASGWLLATSEVRAIIGVKPKTKKGSNTFKRGIWVFIKSGKIGNESAWRIEKTISNKESFNSDNSASISIHEGKEN